MSSSTTGRRGTCRLGIPAARALPGQGHGHHHLPLDRHGRGAAALPRPLAPARGAASALSRGAGAPAARHRAGGGADPEGRAAHRDRAHQRAGAYYSAPQQLAHHASSGCPMETGDLLGSGTISGPVRESRGSLLELSWGGKEPFAIDGGTRSFVEDGDTLTLRGHARGDGFRSASGTARGRCCRPSTTPTRAEDPFSRTGRSRLC
jgi:hypothetical protein